MVAVVAGEAFAIDFGEELGFTVVAGALTDAAFDELGVEVLLLTGALASPALAGAIVRVVIGRTNPISAAAASKAAATSASDPKLDKKWLPGNTFSCARERADSKDVIVPESYS